MQSDDAGRPFWLRGASSSRTFGGNSYGSPANLLFVRSARLKPGKKQLEARRESRAMNESYASRVTRRRKARSCYRVCILAFPLANQAQHNFLLRKSRHLQLEFPARYRVANPITWTLGGPYFYMPTRAVLVPPASYLIPDKGASTSLFLSPAVISTSRFTFRCITLPRYSDSDSSAGGLSSLVPYSLVGNDRRQEG